MIIKTVTVRIGNSDDGLPQKEWARLIEQLNLTVNGCVVAADRHFTGASLPDATWQNYCVVFDLDIERLPSLRAALAVLAGEFNQFAIALTIGETDFVVPGWKSREES